VRKLHVSAKLSKLKASTTKIKNKLTGKRELHSATGNPLLKGASDPLVAFSARGHNFSFSKAQSAVFALVFAIGGFFIVSSLAAVPEELASTSEKNILIEYKKPHGSLKTADPAKLEAYEPVAFRLYGNGLAVCGERVSEEGAKQNEITEKSLSKREMADLIKGITATGFTQLNPEYFKFAPIAGSEETIRAVLPSGQYYTAYYGDTEKPAAFAATTQIIEDLCKTASKPYEPEEVQVRIKKVADAGENNEKTKQARDKWLDKEEKPKERIKGNIEARVKKGREAQQLIEQIGKENTNGVFKDNGETFEVVVDKLPPKAENDLTFIDYEALRNKPKNQGNNINDVATPDSQVKGASTTKSWFSNIFKSSSSRVGQSTSGDGLAAGEILSMYPDPRVDGYTVACYKGARTDGSMLYYLSRDGKPCPGGGTYQYNATSPANKTTYNVACRFTDDRLGYVYNVSPQCPVGSVRVTSGTTTPNPTTPAPTAPTISQSAVGATNISIAWTATANTSSYEIYSNNVLKASQANTGYSVTGLTCNTAYNLFVKAVGSGGSATSNTLTVRTAACPTTTPGPVPTTAETTTDTTVASDEYLSIDPALRATGYTVACAKGTRPDNTPLYYVSRSDKPCPGSGIFQYNILSTQANNTYNVPCKFTDNRLGYVYNVGPACPAGSVRVVKSTTSTNPTPPPSPPGAPQTATEPPGAFWVQMRGDSVSQSGFTVEWIEATGATSYDVYVNGNKVGSTDGSARSFPVSGLSCNYYYTENLKYNLSVVANNSAGSTASYNPYVAWTNQCETATGVARHVRTVILVPRIDDVPNQLPRPVTDNDVNEWGQTSHDWYCAQVTECYTYDNGAIRLTGSRTAAEYARCPKENACNNDDGSFNPQIALLRNIEIFDNGTIYRADVISQIVPTFTLQGRSGRVCGSATLRGTVQVLDTQTNCANRSTIAHELGHNLGWNHSERTTPNLMNATQNCRIPADGGTDGVCQLTEAERANALVHPIFDQPWSGTGSLPVPNPTDEPDFPTPCSGADCPIPTTVKPTLAPGSRPAVVSWTPGRHDLFIKGSDNRLYQRTFANGKWYAWRQFAGTIASDPGVSTWGPGRLDVFVRMPEDKLGHRIYENGQWKAWRILDGQVTGTPGVKSWAPGRLDVFVRWGGTGELYHRYWINDSNGWRSWTNKGGKIHPDFRAPAVASTAVNRLNVYYIGVDQRLYEKTWNGTSWSDPIARGTTTYNSAPAAIHWGGANQRIDLVARLNGTRNISHRWFAGTFVSGTTDIGCCANGGPGVTSWGEDQLSIFIVGTDNNIYWQNYSASGFPKTWTKLP
jgi:hypothetical protein